MKTKQSKDKDFQRRAGLAAQRAIDTASPDIVITVDDAAQELAGKYYVDRPGIRIVFAGVNGGIEDYGYQRATNVTGILERKPAAAIAECLRFLARNGGKGARVVMLCDRSYSAMTDAHYLEEFAWGDIRYLGTRTVDTFSDWQKMVATLSSEADFLLVGGYRQLSDPADGRRLVPAAEVMAWTEAHSAIPVLGINVFNAEDGAMLAVGVSPFEQGEVAARMALKLLHTGESAANMPVRMSSQYVIAMRKSALERRKVTVPQIFEAFARATNNYYD